MGVFTKGSQPHAASAQDGDDDFTDQVGDENYDPTADRKDMVRLGKRQELKRRFRFLSIVGYVVVLGITWEFSIVTSVFSLANGGPAGTIWMVSVVTLGLFTVMLSMAEMASMAPTSGGQYHWVSEFAPPSLQKPLSYAVGVLVAFGWQAAMPAVAYIGAQQVVALIAVCKPEYVIEGWHTALITMALATLAIIFNTIAIGKLPLLEGVAVALHFGGFIAIMALLWIYGDTASAEDTFTTFRDDNQWGSVGLASLVGIIGPATTFIGGDSAVHLAEEVQDAAYVVPRAMFLAAVTNYFLGFAMTITLVFNLGDLDAALASRTEQPWVYVIQTITQSKAAVIAMLVEMTIMFFFCGVNQVTTSSRQVFAFARDKGLPFHEFLSRVDSKGVPRNSIWLTLAFTCILSAIVAGSVTAFNIIVSLLTTGLFTSYWISIATCLARKLMRKPFPPGQFNLGKLGIAVNILALCFLAITYIFLFFPAAPHPDAADMNWAILIYGVVVIFAVLYYILVARHVYEGPVTTVRKTV